MRDRQQTSRRKAFARTRIWPVPAAMALAVALVVSLTGAAAQAGAAPKIRIEQAWARPGIGAAMPAPGASPGGHGTADMQPMPGTSAIYMTIHNDGTAADRLIGAAADVARTVEIHETRIEAGMAQMGRIEGILVPAKGKAVLKPRGLHVMLIGLRHDLKPGDRFPVTLRFEKFGEVRLTVEVRMP